jgi:cobalt-zinc-cadmium resistance protein CzcA
LNDHFLPPGVKIVPFLDRSDLLHFTTHTVLHNLTEGIILVVIILFFLPRQYSRRADRLAHHSVLAAVRLDLSRSPAYSGEPAVARRARLRHGRRWRGGHGREHRPPSEPKNDKHETVIEQIREAAHEVQRPVFYAIGIIITAYLPIFTLQAVEGRLFRPMAWTVAFALLGALIFSLILAPVLSSFLFPERREGVAQPVHGVAHRPLSARGHLGRRAPLRHRRRGGAGALSHGLSRPSAA